MENIFLSEIWIYPIKSLGGIKLSTAKVLQKGIELDRRWMLVDENGVFMTQRTYHKLSLFKPTIHANEIQVTFGKHAVSFSINQFKSAQAPAKVWNSDVQVHEVDDEVSSWFSEMLGQKCKLIFFPETNPRKVEDPYQENISLADAFPILTIGQSSLDDLNNRISSESVPMNRFRPNLVVSGETPYQEESWKNFSIGNTQFLGTRRSYRCIVTTINQETGEKGREPLLTLSKYRREGTQIFFGLNTLVLSEGEIKVGDVITIER